MSTGTVIPTSSQVHPNMAKPSVPSKPHNASASLTTTRYSELPLHLKPCPLCGSDQVQMCRDGNNTAKDKCRCRKCGCTAPLTVWNANRLAARGAAGPESESS